MSNNKTADLLEAAADVVKAVAPKAWTLMQLKFADEVCAPDNFIRIATEYFGNDVDARYHAATMKRSGGLLPWIFMHSRADQENSMGEFFDVLLTDLVGSYT